MFSDLFDVEATQIKLQTTRQDRYRKFLRIGRGKQEFNMRRGLFQRF